MQLQAGQALTHPRPILHVLLLSSALTHADRSSRRRGAQQHPVLPSSHQMADLQL